MNKFDKKEFMDICRRLNAKPRIEEVILEYSGASFYNKMKDSVARDRRGEVVFCVIRPDGRIITITCAEYPQGIYRIPTGGIGYGEDIIKAVYREIKEELGIDADITDFAGVIKIQFRHGDDSTMFYSYIFILKETGGRLLLDANDDEISEVKEVNIDGLQVITESLSNIPGKWNDWGRFRYVTSNAVLNYLRNMEDICI